MVHEVEYVGWRDLLLARIYARERAPFIEKAICNIIDAERVRNGIKATRLDPESSFFAQEIERYGERRVPLESGMAENIRRMSDIVREEW